MTEKNTDTSPNERVLQKVRALLAKAESTEFAEEAAALTAKAHELIAAHAIDLAMVEEKRGRGDVESRMIFIDAPYPKEKFLLLAAASRASNCRAILGLGDHGYGRLRDEDRLDEIDTNGEFAWLVGYSSDLDSVELLFTSLLLQAVNVMLGQGSRTDWSGKNRTKSFRRSFLAGFAGIVGQRLHEASTRAASAASAAHGTSVLPVLASRLDAVNHEVDDQFPKLSSLRTSVTNYEGAVAGRAAGRSADIGTSQIGKRRRALR
jgi:hypothetical protein